MTSEKYSIDSRRLVTFQDQRDICSSGSYLRSLLYQTAAMSLRVALLASLLSVCPLPLCQTVLGQECSISLDRNGDAVVNSDDVFLTKNPDSLTTLLQCLDIPRGDADLSGDIGFIDFLVMSNNYGQSYNIGSAEVMEGDFNVDGIIDLQDFAYLAVDFGEVGFQTPPPTQPPRGLELLGTPGGQITISGNATAVGGIEFTSAADFLVTNADGNLVFGDPAPFGFFLSNTTDRITLGSLIEPAFIDGSVTLDAGLAPQSSPSDITMRWFEQGSYEVFSSQGTFEPFVCEGDINNDGAVTTADFALASSAEQLQQIHQCLNIPRGDLNFDRRIDFEDFLGSLENFGALTDEGYSGGDLNLDGNVDIQDFAFVSTSFGQTGYRIDAEVEPAEVSLVVNEAGGPLTIIARNARLGGLELNSATSNLIPVPGGENARPWPFAFLLENSEERIVFGRLGDTIFVDGDLTLPASTNAVSANDITARWFQAGSPQVFSANGTDLSLVADCNGDGVLDAADLECICSTGLDPETIISATGAIPGDLDLDGTVDFPDFVRLSFNFGQDVVGYSDGDLDCDGTVTFPDFLEMTVNYGRSSAVTASGALAAVPEPESRSMLLCCICLLGTRRTRR